MTMLGQRLWYYITFFEPLTTQAGARHNNTSKALLKVQTTIESETYGAVICITDRIDGGNATAVWRAPAGQQLDLTARRRIQIAE